MSHNTVCTLRRQYEKLRQLVSSLVTQTEWGEKEKKQGYLSTTPRKTFDSTDVTYSTDRSLYSGTLFYSNQKIVQLTNIQVLFTSVFIFLSPFLEVDLKRVKVRDKGRKGERGRGGGGGRRRRN